MQLYICSERNQNSSVILSSLLMDEAMARGASWRLYVYLNLSKGRNVIIQMRAYYYILQINLDLIFISEL